MLGGLVDERHGRRPYVLAPEVVVYTTTHS
jgi:hypothetical protein